MHPILFDATDVTEVRSAQPGFDFSSISPCNHEEAHARVLLHAAGAVKKGYTKILIKTVGTDVFVLSVAYADRIGAEELWVAFGTGKSFRYLPAHSISQQLQTEKTLLLLAFTRSQVATLCRAFQGMARKQRGMYLVSVLNQPRYLRNCHHLSRRLAMISA